MVRKRKELPDVGDLVVGTIEEVFDQGAYVRLDEYGGLRAYLPWNEVSSRWIRSIKDYLRVGQKAVFKVIRVDRRKKYVDISLKRVFENERRRKMLEWKRAVKAEKLLELAAQKLGKTLDEAYEEAGWKLEDHYGEIYAGLEEAVLRGPEALLEAGVPEDWANVLAEVAKKHIEIRKVKIKGVVTARCIKPDGVDRIREVLMEAYNSAGDGVNVRLYSAGAPRYVLEVEANDYKIAEKALAQILEAMEKKAKELEVEISFTREKR